MDAFLQDIRFGVKLLGKDRAFAAAAIVTLAVCIGANATVFTVLNSMVLRPLPVPDSDRLILMGNSYPGAGAPEGTNSGVPDYFDRRAGVTAFAEQALCDTIGASLTIDNIPQRVTAMTATPSLFPLLKVPTFDLPLDLRYYTPFQQAVWKATEAIPYGETRAYAWVAKRIKLPNAVRAVGQALGANPVPILIP